MAAIGGVAYLTSGTGVPAYLLSRAAMSATSMALDPKLRRQWAVGDWPGALAASQAHLPLWGPLHSVSDAVGRRDYVQAALHTGVFALDAAGLRYAGRQPGRLPAQTVPKTTVKLDPKRTQHIFRNTEGHIKDTPANRQLLERIANNPKYRLGPDEHGNMYHGLTRLDGTQVWVIIRDGQITNGGINLVPKTYNPKTGLCAPTPPKQK